MDWANKDAAAEWAIDVAAAAIFAASVAIAAWALAAAGSVIAVAAVPAFLLACAGLRRVPAEERRYELPAFAIVPLELADDLPGAGDELLLDDQLSLESDARVVQLFERRRGPRPCEQESVPADASEALSEALAELRRMLR